MADRQLTVTEWAVRHAAADMLKRGTFPTFDRLYECDALVDVEEADIRGACNELVRLGKFPASVEPEEIETNGPVTSRALNIALFRIVECQGSPYLALAAITGLSVNSIKCRVSAAREYPSDEIEPADGELNGIERGQLSRSVERYLDHVDDPAVREFASSTIAARRGRPGARSMTRDHANDRRRAYG